MPPADTVDSSGHRSRWQRAIRGRADDPAWVRPAFLGLLVGTAVLYLWGLGASGWANSFYSAAVQAGHEELEGVLLRLLRLGELHHRRQAARRALGDGALGPDLRRQLVEHPRARRRSRAWPRSACSTRRSGGGSRPAPGCSPARCWRLTPVAALMFRFNNPDALLVLLLVGRGLRRDARARSGADPLADAGRARWSGSASSPRCCRRSSSFRASALVYLVVRADHRFGGGCVQLLAAGVAIVVAAGWWVAAVMLTPAAMTARTSAARTTTHPATDLRLQRLRPADRQRDRQRRRRRPAAAPACGARPGSPGCSAPTWVARSPGCCPPRSLLGVAALWALRRTPRTDRPPRRGAALGRLAARDRAGLHLRPGDHPPLLHGGAGAGGRRAGRHRRGHAVALRRQLVGRVVLALTLAATALWSYHAAAAQPVVACRGCACVVLVVGLLAAGCRAWSCPARCRPGSPRLVAGRGWRARRRAGRTGGVLPADGSDRASGRIPTAGPTVGGARLWWPGRRARRWRRRLPAAVRRLRRSATAARLPAGRRVRRRCRRGGAVASGGGGLLNRHRQPALTAALTADASAYSWVAATVGSDERLGLPARHRRAGDGDRRLQRHRPGADPGAVRGTCREGKIHYFIGGGGGMAGQEVPGGGQGGAVTRARSRSGSSRTSPLPRSAEPRCTT